MNKVKFEHLLPQVIKPSRYLGVELNRYNKTPQANTANFCLAFPDVYEVGLSHLGLKILYKIINQLNTATCDRVYAPWPDFADLLKQEQLPLFGVEQRLPLASYDVLGFTLQSEVTYTNILYMLNLANIPLKAANRLQEHPIVLAGGPCATNPQPLAPFFDAFFIGEAEEGIIEIANAIATAKDNGADRKTVLQDLATIPGVWVPAVHGTDTTITSRKYTAFANNPQDGADLIPWLQLTHDRWNMEIMRGCTRGCRFCHAGYFYRPVREREPQSISNGMVKKIKESGWEEAALTSLSSSDYSAIRPLMSNLAKRLKANGAKLSLPSLRVDSFDQELVCLINTLGGGGLTIAPEAGSQNLRDVINKNISEEEILAGVNLALQNGWQLIKLYFMIGLPLETPTDIQGIVDLVKKIISLSGKKLRINITLSPFVPKAFTPFQWAGMRSIDYVKDVVYQVRQGLNRYKFVKVGFHQPQQSFLEAVLTQGDDQVANLIEQAYKNGARFDGWTEHFNFELWEQAAQQLELDWHKYLEPKSEDAPLPWDFIDIGVSKRFLLGEWHKSQIPKETPDCRHGCQACGLCVDDIATELTKANPQNMPPATVIEKPETNQQVNPWFYRVWYAKTGSLRYVGHLDMLRMLHRVIRMADIPILYTQGFNPHPRISLSAPVSLGVDGCREFFDLALETRCDLEELKQKLSAVAPFTVLETETIAGKKEMSMEYWQYEQVRVEFPPELSELLQTGYQTFSQAPTWPYTRTRKNKQTTVDLKELIPQHQLSGLVLSLTKSLRGASTFDILESIFNIDRIKAGQLDIARICLLADIDKK